MVGNDRHGALKPILAVRDRIDSILLQWNGPGGIRTHDSRIRNPEPYPC